MNIKQQFKEGLITNNPVLVQLVGMCSTMAITTSLFNGVGMGLSVLIILTCCNVVISALRKIIPNDIRLAIFVVIIAGFVTIVDLMLQAFVPALAVASRSCPSTQLSWSQVTFSLQRAAPPLRDEPPPSTSISPVTLGTWKDLWRHSGRGRETGHSGDSCTSSP